MDGTAAQLLIKALDGLSAREAVTAENIANASTPNYRPLRLSFEQALAEASTKGEDAIRAVSLKMDRAVANSSDGRLRLDLELATANATALRYGALVDLLSSELQIDALPLAPGS
jgi:flagellar basal-body rod protein FlgB